MEKKISPSYNGAGSMKFCHDSLTTYAVRGFVYL